MCELYDVGLPDLFCLFVEWKVTGFENISFDLFELLAVILKTACERLQIFGSFQ